MNSKTILDLDKERKYDLNLNAMINFEEETGVSLINIDETHEFNLKEIRAMLWAGLNEFEEISIEEVGKLIGPSNMGYVSNQIMNVYQDAVPENDDQGEGKGKNKKRPVG